MDTNRASKRLTIVTFSVKNGHCKQDQNIIHIFTANIVKTYQQITRDLFFVNFCLSFCFIN